MIGRFFRDILTGVSNQEYEISRVLSLAAVASYIVYAGLHLVMNKIFDPMGFGAGFGAILLAAGFGTAAKDRAKTEADTAIAAEGKS
jgi:hypothetical protein